MSGDTFEILIFRFVTLGYFHGVKEEEVVAFS
jgi:hypothetical protein